MNSKVYLGHLSDLHIGGSMYGNQPWRTKVWPFNYFQSDNPHDDELAFGLSNVWSGPDNVKRRLNLPPEYPIWLAITGDLTRRGGQSDFDLAKRYIESSWPPPEPGWIRGPGLRQGQSDSYGAVPGNHDQWAGMPYWQLPAAFYPFLYRKTFGNNCWGPKSIYSNDRRLLVEVYGIDSNSGHKNRRFSRSQGGRIDPQQYRQLRDRMSGDRMSRKSSDAIRVRVMLCHHSFDNVFSNPAPLHDVSRRELIDFAGANGVAVVLTGHTHYADWKSHPTRQGGHVWEIRASSALAAPSAATTDPPLSITDQPEICAHGFWVHEIARDESTGAPIWKSHPFLWGERSFQQFQPIEMPLAY